MNIVFSTCVLIGHHSALTGNDKLTVTDSVKYWINKGMPAKKIALGMATYGRSFQLSDSSQTGIGATVKGPGTKGTYTREKGFLSFYEICKLPLTVVTDNVAKAPYGFYSDQWVGFELPDSLKLKVGMGYFILCIE